MAETFAEPGELWDFGGALGLREPVFVGGIGLTREGRICPMTLEVRITGTQRRLLRVLLEDYPRYAPWNRLLPEGWEQTEVNRRAIRKPISLMRWAIADLGVWIVPEIGRGYRLVETP